MRALWTPEEDQKIINAKMEGRITASKWEKLSKELRRSVGAIKNRRDVLKNRCDTLAEPGCYKKNEDRDFKWDGSATGSPYERAKIKLGWRHNYDFKNGHIVDGKPVTVQEMIRIAEAE